MSTLNNSIRGSGGGGKGGAGADASDTLFSRQYARVLGALSEGPIEGPIDTVHPGTCVYLNGNPLEVYDSTTGKYSWNYNADVNPDSTYTGISTAYTYGTWDQSTVPGFDYSENTQSVGLPCKMGVDALWVIRTACDAIRFAIEFPGGLVDASSTDGAQGTSVRFEAAIQYGTTGTFNLAPVGNRVVKIGPISSIDIAASISKADTAVAPFRIPMESTATFKATSSIATYSGFGNTILPTNIVYEAVSTKGAATITFPATTSVRTITSRVKDKHGKTVNSISRVVDATITNGYLPTAYYTVKCKNSTTGTLYPMNISLNIPTVGPVEIVGKASGKYLAEYSFTVPINSPLPYTLRIRRKTPDSNTIKVQNSFTLSQVTAIINTTFNYPYTALLGIEMDSRYFNSIPTVGFDCRLLIVQVPSTYFPKKEINYSILGTVGGWPSIYPAHLQKYTRTPIAYPALGIAVGADIMPQIMAGTLSLPFWDGTFYASWTDNPAWCYYDLITNKRYGLGEYTADKVKDVVSLYKVAQYCDELVPSGDVQGTTKVLEPRFTCNVWLNKREDAYKLMNSMASIFRSMLYWSSTVGLTAVQDAPTPPSALFTNANIISGDFNYTGSASQARHNVVQVSWDNPEEFYRPAVEYVEDRDAVLAGAPINKSEVVAFGCTSRGQAHRLGLWMLYTEKLETSVVSFKTGYEAATIAPGNIINILDKYRGGARNAGRLVSATNAIGLVPTTIVLDSSVTFDTTKAYSISIQLPITDVGYSAVPWVVSAATYSGQFLSYSGRIYRVSSDTNYPYLGLTAPTHTVDSSNNPVSASSGSATLTYYGPEGNLYNSPITFSTIQTGIQQLNTITVTNTFTTLPDPSALWMIYATNLVPETYRVLTVVEESKGLYAISALEHNPSKFDFVEKNLVIQQPSTSIISLVPGPIVNIQVTPSTYLINPQTAGEKLLVSWDAEPSSAKYRVSYIENNNNTVSLPETTNTTAEIFNVTTGNTYKITVVGISSLGKIGP
jgi:predicted phage tail protein